MANFKIPLKEPSAMVDVKSDAEPSTDDRILQPNVVQSSTKPNSNSQTSVPAVDQPQQTPNGQDNKRPFKRLSEIFIDFLNKCLAIIISQLHRIIH